MAAATTAASVLVVGDSHTDVWKVARLVPAAAGCGALNVVVLRCSGASAQGLGNPNSKSQSGHKWRRAAAAFHARGAVALVVQVGGADLEYVFHHKRLRDGGRHRLNIIKG